MLQLLNGRPIWGQLFYLLRIGRVTEAVEEAVKNRSVLDSRQRDFVGQFQKWALSVEPRFAWPPSYAHNIS